MPDTTPEHVVAPPTPAFAERERMVAILEAGREMPPDVLRTAITDGWTADECRAWIAIHDPQPPIL